MHDIMLDTSMSLNIRRACHDLPGPGAVLEVREPSFCFLGSCGPSHSASQSPALFSRLDHTSSVCSQACFAGCCVYTEHRDRAQGAGLGSGSNRSPPEPGFHLTVSAEHGGGTEGAGGPSPALPPWIHSHSLITFRTWPVAGASNVQLSVG